MSEYDDIIKDLLQPCTYSFEAKINEDFFDALSCDFFDIYFVSEELSNQIDMNNISNRILIIPYYICDPDKMYKVVDKKFKLYIYKQIKDNLSLFRGKKEV